jgi:hypothetical protein
MGDADLSGACAVFILMVKMGDSMHLWNISNFGHVYTL